MVLKKIESGLLENKDYFLDSLLTDFLGDGIFTRDEHGLHLKRGYIERRFPYNEYVILAEKKPVELSKDQAHSFYVRQLEKRAGIIEQDCLSAHKYKLIKNQGFIQSYVHDGNEWVVLGGGEEKYSSDVQGFSVEGDIPLTITGYSVYKSPFVTIHNLSPLTYVQFIAGEGEHILYEGTSDNLGTLMVYMNDCFYGSIKMFVNGEMVFQTDNIEINFGDQFMNVEYDIEVIYDDRTVNENPTLLRSLSDSVWVKNTSITDTYENIKVRTCYTNDLIELSLNKSSFSSAVTIPKLEPQQQIEVFIKITKANDTPNYGKRSFALEID